MSDANDTTLIQGSHYRIPVLWQDGRLVVVDKPAGMIVHPNQYDRRAPNCVNTLSGLLHRKVQVVHRLDRGTSGIMLFALDKETAGLISALLRESEITKEYLAIVRGHAPDEGLIERSLVRGEGYEPSASFTRYQTLSRSVVSIPAGDYEESWFSLLRVTLLTGRWHQARRHLQSISHPIIGDNRHGDRLYNEIVSGMLGSGRMYLRAFRLELTLPYSGSVLTVRAGLPDAWTRACTELDLDLPEDAMQAEVIRDGQMVYRGDAPPHVCPPV
ncbi:MAG: pseudouridylate synthase [Spirochaetaceae bacterium]|nr:MAG: pseudouridylate synthase [Spirochaetaceae bacterium]